MEIAFRMLWPTALISLPHGTPISTAFTMVSCSVALSTAKRPTHPRRSLAVIVFDPYPFIFTKYSLGSRSFWWAFWRMPTNAVAKIVKGTLSSVPVLCHHTPFYQNVIDGLVAIRPYVLTCYKIRAFQKLLAIKSALPNRDAWHLQYNIQKWWCDVIHTFLTIFGLMATLHFLCWKVLPQIGIYQFSIYIIEYNCIFLQIYWCNDMVILKGHIATR